MSRSVMMPRSFVSSVTSRCRMRLSTMSWRASSTGVFAPVEIGFGVMSSLTIIGLSRLRAGPSSRPARDMVSSALLAGIGSDGAMTPLLHLRAMLLHHAAHLLMHLFHLRHLAVHLLHLAHLLLHLFHLVVHLLHHLEHARHAFVIGSSRRLGRDDQRQ